MRSHLGPKTKMTLQCLGLLCAAALAGCSPAATTPATPPDSRAADEAAINKADQEWMQAAATSKVDGWMKYYTADVVIQPPNAPRASGTAEVRKVMEGLFALPDVKITWKAEKITVARSGEIGYLYGNYELSFKDKGKTISESGKMVEVFHKQADGSWKCGLDMWSPNAPAK